MITGSLQKKKGLYYTVLNLYDEYGKRKPNIYKIFLIFYLVKDYQVIPLNIIELI